MLEMLIIIYIVVGSASAVTNLGNWIFKSKIFALPFVPFLITYYLIKGDKTQKKEAVLVLKGIGLFIAAWAFFTVIFYLIKFFVSLF